MSAAFGSIASAATSVEADKTVTVTKPAGVADGNLMVAIFSFRRPTADFQLTPPAGWKLFHECDCKAVGGTPTAYIYSKIANNEPANYIWTWDKDAQAVAFIVRITGHDGEDLADSLETDPGSTTHKTPDVRTRQANMFTILYYDLAKTSSFTGPGGVFTERADIASGASNGITGAVYTGVVVAKGLTGQFTGTSADVEVGIGAIITINDAVITESIVGKDTDTPTKSVVLNAVDSLTGAPVRILDGEAGNRLSLKSVLLTTAAALTVRLQDSAGRIMLPDVTFPVGGGIFERTFERGKFRTAPSASIDAVGNATAELGIELDTFVDETE